MSLTSWRQFPFFDCVPIKDPSYGSQDGKILYSDSTVSALCSTPRYLVIASEEAKVKFVNSDFQLVSTFAAYDPDWTITRMQHVSGGNSLDILCTIAEKQGQPLQLKLWDVSRVLEKQIDYNSDFRTSCKVSNAENNYPLTCFASSSDFSVLAFGFANGTVILVRGDMLHDRGSRQRVVYESEEPVTNVKFRDDSLLFVTTVTHIATVQTSGRNRGQPETVLDPRQGADIHCSDMVLRNGRRNLVVARNDAIQFYTPRGRGKSLLLEVPKKRVHTFHERYLLLLTSTTTKIAGSAALTNGLLVIDIVDKYIAFNRTVPSPAIEVFAMWGDLYVYTSDGILYRLHEKPLQEKLEILVQRELFSEAIKLAEEGDNGEQIDPIQVMKIEKQYGDFLYSKDDFATAIDQYIKCIELGKTSEVIQKYKESSKIQYLTKYLEQLVATGNSTEDHITLLLSSYCKLKQDDKILAYVDSLEVSPDYEVVDPLKDFDKPTVISLCRESSYFKLAAHIAKKFNLASTVVDIESNDLKKPKAAMQYMRQLPIDELLHVLLENVQPLLDQMANDTTQLLIDVFTGHYKPDTPADSELESVASSAPSAPSKQDYPVMTSYKQFFSYMKVSDTPDAAPSAPTYLPPKPRLIFQYFVGHPNEFVIFLEACIESYDRFGGNEKDKKDIMATLYEMYLNLAAKMPDERAQWEAKAKSLLETIQAEKNWTSEETTTLLLLSNVFGYNEGEIMIRESADEASEGFGVDLFRSAVLSQDYLRSYDLIEKYGEREPDLYCSGISVYTSREDIYKQIGETRILNLIDKIERNKLLTPLELIKQLSRNNNGFVKLGLVKDYLINYIKRQKLEINNNDKLIDSYKKESDKTDSEINDLLHNNQTVNQPRCASCTQPLDFPVIHFKCGHTYHEHCLLISKPDTTDLEEEDLECPRCSSQYDSMQALKRQEHETGMKNEMFDAALEGSSDRLKVMMGFIGRGAMEPTRVLYENDV